MLSMNWNGLLSSRSPRICAGILALSCIAIPAALHAQEIAGGQRLAIQTSRIGWIEGRFHDIRGDTVVIERSKSGALYAIPYDSVLAWRVPAPGRVGRMLRSSLLGGAAGAMAGAGVGFEGANKVSAPSEMRRESMRFGLGGFAIGAVFGALPRWRDVNVRLARAAPGEELLVMQGSVPGAAALVEQTPSFAASTAPNTIAPPNATERAVITRSELESIQGVTALDAIRRLRPHFLAARRAEVGREALVTPVVFLDGIRLGELDVLQQIQLRSILEIQYFSPTEATMRWGMGHGGGVIHVILRRA